MDEELAPIQTYNRKDLLSLYGTDGRPIRYETFHKWIEPIKENLGDITSTRKFSVAQVEKIFNHLGHPRIHKHEKK